MLNSIDEATAHLPQKLQKFKICTTETARGITILLAYGFDVDFGEIDHPELEEKL